MVKFTSPTDSDFRRVLSHLQRIIGSIPLPVARASPPSYRDLQASLLPSTSTTNSNNTDRRAILNVLGTPQETFSRHTTALNRHLDGTGTWMLEHPAFQNWLVSPNSFLWIRGPSEQCCVFILIAPLMLLIPYSWKWEDNALVRQRISVLFCLKSHDSKCSSRSIYRRIMP